MNIEAALITKVLETKDISKTLDSKVSGCLRVYGPVWKFVQDFYIRFKTIPSIEVVQRKFPEFEEERIEGTSIDYLIEEVMTDHLRFKMEELLTNTAKTYQDNPREALQYLQAKATAIGHQTDVVKDIDLAADYWIRLENLKERTALVEKGQSVLGIPSTIKPIDYLFGGWKEGDFIVIMGWTGSGKTWLSTYFAVQAWLMGKRPLYFSLEMNDKKFGYRFDTLLGKGLFSNVGLVNARKVDIGTYEAWAETTFADKHPFYLVTTEGMDEVDQFSVQNKIEQYKPDIVFLDYHSLFDDAKKGKSETERHGNLSRDFKRMAERFSVPIVDIVAVTMEDGHGTRPPELHEVAWSKKLAYDADLVLSLCKSGAVMTVESKKTRDCDAFAFDMGWDFDSGSVTVLDS